MSLKRPQVFSLSKGFVGRSNNCFRIAKPKVQKALLYAYRDRRTKKRTNRSTFISQINAGTRIHGLAYNEFIHGLVVNNIQLNRKVLADLAVNEPYSFQALVKQVQSTISTRDIDLKKSKAIPEKFQFLPMSWETFKTQVKLHDELEAAYKTSDPQSQLNSFFTESIAKAKEQNIADIKAGKVKLLRPRFQMDREEREQYDAMLKAKKEKIAKIKESQK